MQSLFRVYLDGFFLQNEPKGLPATELTITRDELLKGVFFNFTSELVFYGDGYRILKDARDDSPTGCANVPCNIEFRCAETGGWEILYSAIVPIGSDEVEWDDYNCRVTTRLENADFSNFLKKYGDYVFRPNTPFCIDGVTALPPITTNLTEFFGSFSGTLLGNGLKTHLFTDVFDQLLRFLSNNSVTLDADPLYSTLYLPQVIDLNFVDPITAGDTIVFTFTNYFGQQYTSTYNAVGVIGEEVFATLHLLHIVDENTTPIERQRTNFFEKVSFISQSGATLTLHNYLPWSAFSVSVNGGAKNATMVESQAFQYGLKNLGITNSALIQGQDGSLITTLSLLLNHASTMHNMGFRNIKAGANYSFQLRQLKNLLDDNSTNILLKQVAAVSSKTSKMFDAQGITTAGGIADNIFKPFSWNSNTCYSQIMRLEAEKFSTQEFFDILNATQVQDNELFYVFLKEGDYTEVERYESRIIDNDPNPVTAQDAFQFHYNIPYVMPLIAKAYEVNVANNNLTGQVPESPFDTFSTCTNCPDARILNDNNILLRNVTKIQHPLTYTQVRTLIDNALLFINFTDSRTSSTIKKGFIKEAKIPFKNFLTTFELYTE